MDVFQQLSKVESDIYEIKMSYKKNGMSGISLEQDELKPLYAKRRELIKKIAHL